MEFSSQRVNKCVNKEPILMSFLLFERQSEVCSLRNQIRKWLVIESDGGGLVHSSFVVNQLKPSNVFDSGTALSLPVTDFAAGQDFD